MRKEARGFVPHSAKARDGSLLAFVQQCTEIRAEEKAALPRQKLCSKFPLAPLSVPFSFASRV